MTTQNPNTPSVVNDGKQQAANSTAGGEFIAKTAKELFSTDNIRNKFNELLGKRATAFITSVLQVVASSDMLKNADPQSIYNAAAVAATLDLPLNNQIGHAYIVPYNVKQKDNTWKVMAQFILGYKGLKQLALRSGQFSKLNCTDVREGEIINNDRLSGDIEFKWIQDDNERLQKKVIGYISYFRLINGFEHTFFMTIEKIHDHGKKYSKNYGNVNSLWKTDFDGMASKTVTKLNLSKNAPLSVEMQTAIRVDQAVINDPDAKDITYVDNESTELTVNKEKERMTLLINDAKSLEQLESFLNDIEGEEMEILFREKHAALSAKLLQK
jgi:recombination protein RecT